VSHRAWRSCDREGGVSRALEPAHKGRKLVSGTAQNRKQVVDEAGHAAGMSAQHEHETYYDGPADCPGQGYRSGDAAGIQLPAAIRATTIAARCSVLARFAFALETRLIQGMYPQAPSVGMPGTDPSHAGQNGHGGCWWRSRILPKQRAAVLTRTFRRHGEPYPAHSCGAQAAVGQENWLRP